MRFHIMHLIGLVAAVAVVLGAARHPEALKAAIVPLLVGLFVIVPVLGVTELLTPRDQVGPQLGWRGTLLVGTLGVVGFAVVLALLALIAS